MTGKRDDWFGLHERLATRALRKRLAELGLENLAAWRTKPAADELPAAVQAHLARVLASLLLSLRERDRGAWESMLSELSEALQNMDHPLAGLIEEIPALPFEQLLEVSRPEHNALGAQATVRPDLSLGLSALLTGSRHSPSLVSQIEKELASADRADWLVSFIKFSGIRALKSALQRFVEQPNENGEPRLRIATTSYLGATDLKAIETLLELPNTEVRVSYDTHRTRLHAKAYLFHRRTGFGTAYIGSANVSRVALDEGLEWTARISQHELAHLWRQVVAGFDMHWNDPAEFEPAMKGELERLAEALDNERQGTDRDRTWHFLDLRPHAFQQEILEAIEAERGAGLSRHLVIAATGTGKTMIAAFDYRRFAANEEGTNRPSMLFVAHREEILKQALNTFRHVLRDESFGDLLVGGRDPRQSRHLFCSVQSWNARNLDQLAPDHFDYVVFDEAHHAVAASYQRILEHIQPRSLLGLTATPERNDGGDIRDDFGGSFTHEMRLPDAIEARHLVPFHYFGIADAPGVDFSGLAWQRGAYRIDDLDRVIGSNERRARWVLGNLIDHVAEPKRIRALGFCVSKTHAHFMARYLSAHGVPAEALTADSPTAFRRDIQRRLVNFDIRVIFTVDLFNEGVDIPEVDTVLLLRPTESLTVYLQQLGRGLRLHEGKAHLTVLDFIAPQHRNFRFADRFRALSSRAAERVDRQIEEGFPWLPAGCLVRLDEQAEETVLDNIRSALILRKPQLIAELTRLRQDLGDQPSLQQMLEWLHFDEPDLLLKHGLPCRLLEQAGGEQQPNLGKFEKGLVRGLRQVMCFDDREQLVTLQQALHETDGLEDAAQQQLPIALSLLWAGKRPDGGVDEALAILRNHSGLRRDLDQVIDWRLRGLLPVSARRFPKISGPLVLHATYTREQILLALGKGDFETPASHREGVLHVPDYRVDAFFVTINKSKKHFSPSTQYEDYAINQELFHWQSQSVTTPESPTGQRYINHREMGYQPLLFVREAPELPSRLTEPFRYLGPVNYVRHEGSKPMNITWRLKHPLLATNLRQYKLEAV
jgi:superfamily II DNA or RNA helicase/HKD family nuclease